MRSALCSGVTPYSCFAGEASASFTTSCPSTDVTGGGYCLASGATLNFLLSFSATLPEFATLINGYEDTDDGPNVLSADVPGMDVRLKEDLKDRSSFKIGPNTLNVTVPSYNISIDSLRYVFEVNFVNPTASSTSQEIETVDLPSPVGNDEFICPLH